jgi:hypothetical protein
MADCTEGSGHTTNVDIDAQIGFATRAAAEEALAAAILATVERDRKQAGKDCGARSCDGDCVTSLLLSVNDWDKLPLYAYRAGGQVRYGWRALSEWAILSGCTCLPAPRKKAPGKKAAPKKAAPKKAPPKKPAKKKR